MLQTDTHAFYDEEKHERGTNGKLIIVQEGVSTHANRNAVKPTLDYYAKLLDCQKETRANVGGLRVKTPLTKYRKKGGKRFCFPPCFRFSVVEFSFPVFSIGFSPVYRFCLLSVRFNKVHLFAVDFIQIMFFAALCVVCVKKPGMRPDLL